MPLRHSALSLFAVLLAYISVAVGDAVEDKDVMAAIKAKLQQRFPEVQIVDVQPAPMPGWYEIYSRDSIAYVDQTGEYLLSGQLLETQSKRNLTQARMDERNRIDFKTLPLDQAIKTVKGSGKRQLAVFSDPDCPYCQQLEKELASVTDVTIYTFLYPIANLHPQAPEKARAIWCSADRAQAWGKWMSEKKLPTAGSCDAAVIEKNSRLAQQLQVNSTPTLFAGDGRRVSGTIPAAQIEKLLGTSSN